MQYYFFSLIPAELILHCFSIFFVQKSSSGNLISGIAFIKESDKSDIGKPGTFCFKSN